jgi:hypothetical protein
VFLHVAWHWFMHAKTNSFTNTISLPQVSSRLKNKQPLSVKGCNCASYLHLSDTTLTFQILASGPSNPAEEILLPTWHLPVHALGLQAGHLHPNKVPCLRPLRTEAKEKHNHPVAHRLDSYDEQSLGNHSEALNGKLQVEARAVRS